MNRIKFICATLIVLICSGCGVNIATETAQPVLPEFITATLPPTPIPQPTATFLPPTPAPTGVPIEDTTNTQVNVRAETNTASASYGVISAFSPVQVTGKDQSGTWYRILYADSPTGTGWVRADYIQVNAPAEIQVSALGAGSGSEVTGVVISGINVRNGPSTEYEPIGVLVPKDVLLVIGRDSTGAWLEIVFLVSPNGKGWVSAEYLQVPNPEILPITDLAEDATESPPVAADTPAAGSIIAKPDGDTMDAPIASGILSASALRTLQAQGDVSAPEGDFEDWVAFTTSGTSVMLRAECDNIIQVSVWEKGAQNERMSITCGTEQTLRVTPNQMYQLQISPPQESGYTQYRLTISSSK